MKQRRRIYYTETDKALMWDRWEEGESLSSIARFFDRHHSAIQGILSRTGGIRPPRRTRSQSALTLTAHSTVVTIPILLCRTQIQPGMKLRLAQAVHYGHPSKSNRDRTTVTIINERV